jgi:cardiolipin synthase
VGRRSGLDRILTAPNVITLVRLLCIPLFLWLLFGAHRQTAAAVLLAVLGATDWVDGFVARRYHQVSTLGKVLDPTADRILVGTAVIAVIVHGAVPLWFGVATLARRCWCRSWCCCWPPSARRASMCCGWAKRAHSD